MNRAQYRAAVAERYGGQAAWVQRDARGNWEIFEAVREDLLAWLRLYRRDPFLEVAGKCHNSSGTLTGLAWLAGGVRPELVDFEEYFQTCFLRRGLIVYLKLLLADLAAAAVEVEVPGQLWLPGAVGAEECGQRNEGQRNEGKGMEGQA